MMGYIGCDPGLSGGFATLGVFGDDAPTVHKMPATLADMAIFFHTLPQPGQYFVLVEDAHPNPKNGSIAVGKMMRNVGQIEMAVVAHGYRLQRVAAAKWQKDFGLIRKKNETDTKKKNRHKAKAQELYPEVKVTLWSCDALLIANYCRRHHAELF